MSSAVATIISLGTGIALLVGLCAAGFAFLGASREPANWPFALPIGAAVFVSVFHILRYLLNIPFPHTVAGDAVLILALGIFGVWRIRWVFPRLPRDFLLAFAVSAVILLFYPIIIWDMEHHIPAVQDLVRGIHPSAIALSARPFVVGGFYPYGSEAFVASAWMGRGNLGPLLHIVVLVFSLATLWLYWQILRDFFCERAALAALLVFLWAGNLVPLVDFSVLRTGPLDNYLLMKWIGFLGPFPGFFTYAFQMPMSFGFPLFLLILWLFMSGGLRRSFLAGLLVGPLALMQIILAVLSVGLFVSVPPAEAILERRGQLRIREAGLALAGAAVSSLLLGIPFLMKIGGEGFRLGAFWWSCMGLWKWPLKLVFGPFIYLGLSFVLAIPGFFLALRDSAVKRPGLALFLAAATVCLLIPQFFFSPDFVKFFLLASFGYSPLAAVALLWLWKRGRLGKALSLALLLLMFFPPLGYGVLRWWIALRDGFLVIP